jgi:hypothetical protein
MTEQLGHPKSLILTHKDMPVGPHSGNSLAGAMIRALGKYAGTYKNDDSVTIPPEAGKALGIPIGPSSKKAGS